MAFYNKPFWYFTLALALLLIVPVLLGESDSQNILNVLAVVGGIVLHVVLINKIWKNNFAKNTEEYYLGWFAVFIWMIGITILNPLSLKTGSLAISLGSLFFIFMLYKNKNRIHSTGILFLNIALLVLIILSGFIYLPLIFLILPFFALTLSILIIQYFSISVNYFQSTNKSYRIFHRLSVVTLVLSFPVSFNLPSNDDVFTFSEVEQFSLQSPGTERVPQLSVMSIGALGFSIGNSEKNHPAYVPVTLNTTTFGLYKKRQESELSIR